MLPLAGSSLPDSPETLTAALREGFSEHNVMVKEVSARGTWPDLESLKIDLTGAKLSRENRLPKPGDLHNAAFAAAQFELVALPGEMESVPIHASLEAKSVGFEFVTGPESKPLLLMTRAAHGDVSVEVARADLERLLHSFATEAAGKHGVVIKSTKMTFTSRGPRAVTVKAEVVAKMFIATTTVTLDGDIDLNDELVARLSNLRFSGEGMVANLAGGFIRPQLARLEGREFPLMSFALGEISLRDVTLDAGDTLRLTAHFGS